jgi:1-acyl-sn-glycerol-3-phosphate acyltransferase
VVALYPEGRIGLDPGMWPERGKTGVARLALTTGATVVPVAQWGAHEILAYHGNGAMVATLLRAVVRRPVLRVHFGPPVDLTDLSATTTGAALRATERIMAAITEALEPLRVDEPRLPRYRDRTRPVSTARTRERRRRDSAHPITR